ncbi:MAG TPA: DUF4197 domain-containing protein [Bacteroidia bacterium]|jgi:hypothetical protein|nr:DUF4197 domain-containing protein [Bacteroidia bacterium]
MRKLILFVSAMIFIGFAVNAQTLKDLTKKADSVIKKLPSVTTTGTPNSLTNDEVISGLREALTVGTNQSTALASKLDGFYKNPAIFIPFPPEAQQVKEYAKKVGLTAQVTKFEMTLNRAAEEAAKKAAPIFVNAIKGMSITDGFSILKGNDNAATVYLKDKTSAELIQLFTPTVKAAIAKVQLTKYWTPLATSYNKVPLVQKVNPDLTAYVTDRAVQGIFKLIADEELKIRKNPAARVSDLLKKVFGWTGK